MEAQPEPDRNAGRLDLLGMVGAGRRRKRGDARYASFNRRMIAATLDSLLLSAVLSPLVDALFARFYGPVPLELQDLQALGDTAQLWQALVLSGFLQRWLANALVQLVLMAAFSGVCWHFWSATPGKMLTRIAVRDAVTDGKISDRQIWLRLVGYAVSALPLGVGFFWIAFDKRRQGWHDKIAQTVVVGLPWWWEKKAVSTPLSDVQGGWQPPPVS